MMNKLVNRFKTLFTKPIGSQPQTSSRKKRRDGKSEPVDEVFIAWTSGTLEEMIDATNSKTHPVDRHFLLQRIVGESYKLRKNEKYQNICLVYAEQHFSEFDDLAPALKKDMSDTLPRVSVFQNYATVLTETGEYNHAIRVCEKAVEYQLQDGTKSGFKGRINRIRKKMNRA